MTYSAILFDIDNTLIDSATIATKAIQRITKEYGFNVSFKEIRDLIGVPTEQIFKNVGVEPSNDMLSEFKTELTQHKSELNFFDGMSQVFNKLINSDVKVGIVTSRTREEVHSDLSSFNEIVNRDILVTSDDTTESKPSGEPLLFALHKFGLNKDRTLYVGDTLFDLKSAQNAGIDFANASWGSLETVDFSSAEHILDHPSDLLRLG